MNYGCIRQCNKLVPSTTSRTTTTTSRQIIAQSRNRSLISVSSKQIFHLFCVSMHLVSAIYNVALQAQEEKSLRTAKSLLLSFSAGNLYMKMNFVSTLRNLLTPIKTFWLSFLALTLIDNRGKKLGETFNAAYPQCPHRMRYVISCSFLSSNNFKNLVAKLPTITMILTTLMNLMHMKQILIMMKISSQLLNNLIPNKKLNEV